MNTFILIVVLTVHNPSTNSVVTFQEFNSLAQCQYAAKIVSENANRVRFSHCINK